MKRITTALVLAACASAWAQDAKPADPAQDFKARMAALQAEHDATVAKLRAEQAAIAASAAEQQAKEEADLKAQEEAEAALAKKPNAKIGMTAKQVREATNWGEPYNVNRTTTGRHVHEQWVYADNQYLYFDDGRLTAIQNHR